MENIKKEIKKAYIKGITDVISCLAVSSFIAWFVMDIIEKYFI